MIECEKYTCAFKLVIHCIRLKISLNGKTIKFSNIPVHFKLILECYFPGHIALYILLSFQYFPNHLFFRRLICLISYWLTVQSEVSHTHHRPDLSRPFLDPRLVNSLPRFPLKHETKYKFILLLARPAGQYTRRTVISLSESI